MSSIARNSKFNIKIDYEKSKGSYIHDKNTGRSYLDLFGMYASLPLGYNHKVFDTEEFKQEMLRVSKVKTNNCEFTSDEVIEFDKLFKKFAGAEKSHIHYTCTGALAVEAAIKCCLQYKNFHYPKILSFHDSFHGINSYSSFITSRFGGVNFRLNGIPELFSIKIDKKIELVEKHLKSGDITCVIVEPIQCTAGDIYLGKDFLTSLQQICTKYDVPLIMDEVQTGFGATGKCWYHEHFNLKPDIVVFGKKTQVSGIIVSEKTSNIFQDDSAVKLQVTWDGDVVDMVRCKHIIKALQASEWLESIQERGTYLKTNIATLPNVIDVRNSGLIVGFDLTSGPFRDKIIDRLYKNGLICNSTGTSSIRLRPALNIDKKDIDIALQIFNKTFKECS